MRGGSDSAARDLWFPCIGGEEGYQYEESAARGVLLRCWLPSMVMVCVRVLSERVGRLVGRSRRRRCRGRRSLS